MREISYGDAIQEATLEEMRRDDRVYLIGYAVGRHAGSFARPNEKLWAEFGEDRLIETGIIEPCIGGSSVGAAVAGLRPVADFQLVDFMFPALNEVLGFGGMWRYEHGGGGADGMTIPVVFRAGLRTYAGSAAEHTRAPIAVFWHQAGLKVVYPSTPYDAKGLMKTAIRDDNPVVYLEHTRLYQTKGPVPEEEYLIPFGQASVKREGKDVTIVAIGYMVPMALQAAEALEKEKISAEVVDPRTLEPLDIDTILKSVQKTGRLVTVDEDYIRCGVGAEIAFQVQKKLFKSLKAPVERVGNLNTPHPCSPALWNVILPTPEKIAAAAKETMR